MKIDNDPKPSLSFDPERCSQLYSDLVEVFQKHKPTIGEIIIALGNLTYTIGASIEGYGEKGPGIEEVQKLYYMNPEKIGVALMAQGLTVTTWYEDWERLQLEKQGKETKEEGK